MQIHAAVSTVPIQVVLDLSDCTPVGEIRNRVIEQVRYQIENNGQEHVILEASLPELVDGHGRLNMMGFPMFIEYVEVEPPEPDWVELAQLGISGTYSRCPEDDGYESDLTDDV